MVQELQLREVTEEEMLLVNGGNRYDGAVATIAAVGQVAGYCQCYPVAIICGCIVAGYTITIAFAK